VSRPVYIPVRKQTVLTRAGYIGLQIRSMNKWGRSLSIAGRDMSRALALMSCV
jgi:prophage tail gpP-like protein